MDERIDRLLERLKNLFVQNLGSDLVGIYVHGSLAFGCFTWGTGDVDLLVVAESEPSLDKKRSIITGIMEIEAEAPPKGIEMSVVLEKNVRHFVHPTPYVMHYSKAHTEAYIADMDNSLMRLRGTDRDLAAHFTVIHAVGYPIAGPDVKELFDTVPAGDYFDSIMCDVGDSAGAINDNPVYLILNLCRVLAYVRKGMVVSKDAGGEWGLAHLPELYRPIVQKALSAYRTGGDEAGVFDGALCGSFAEYMLECIRCESEYMGRGSEA